MSKIVTEGLHLFEDNQPKEETLPDDQVEALETQFFLVYYMHIQPSEIEKMSETTKQYLIQRYIHQKQVEKQAMDEMGLSARAYDKVRRVARTIADLDGAANIQELHVAEAVQYRLLDRRF